jgi:HK97 family phage portal protein
MQTLNLTAKQYTSRVLDSWLSEREGGHVRAGVVALGENSTSTNMTADQLANMLGAAYTTASGAVVTAETAMRVTTVYACVALVAGAIASLPVAIYDRETGAKADHDYWWLFNEKACDGWTAATAWEYLISSKLLHGDGFAQLLRASFHSNRIIGWKPLHPNRVEPFRDAEGTLWYRVTDTSGKQSVLHSADMLHIPSLGFDGLRSPSPITYAAREAIGTSMAAEKFSGQFFSQGSTHDIALKTKSSLTKEQADGVRASYLARQAGSRGPLVLHGGLEVEKLSITPVDAELLPTRLFGVNEICRALGVPPHMVAHTEKTTSWGSGIAEQGAGFVRYTLLRHINPLRQELNTKLWPVRQRFYIEHVTEGLERADLQARSNAHRVALGRAGEPAWMTVNEVREIENLQPIAGGNTLNTGTEPKKEAPNEPEAAATAA